MCFIQIKQNVRRFVRFHFVQHACQHLQREFRSDFGRFILVQMLQHVGGIIQAERGKHLRLLLQRQVADGNGEVGRMKVVHQLACAVDILAFQCCAQSGERGLRAVFHLSGH